MPSLAQDMAFVQTACDQLEPYIHSEVLFWPLTSPQVNIPWLTPGGLLLALRRVKARCRQMNDEAQVSSLETRLGVTQNKWPLAWEKKCRLEIQSRLGVWRSFVTEYSDSPEKEAENYQSQATGRTILELLPENNTEVVILEELDKIVKSCWVPGEFIWERDLMEEFPEPKFWFLHGRLKS